MSGLTPSWFKFKYDLNKAFKTAADRNLYQLTPTCCVNHGGHSFKSFRCSVKAILFLVLIIQLISASLNQNPHIPVKADR